jgi:signal transduction histidine kinase
VKDSARRAWLIFGFCAAFLLAAVAAMSWQILRSEGAQLDSEARARLESRVRLALWRLDSRVTPLIASESARTHETFVSPPEEALAPEIKLRFARKGTTQITSADIDDALREDFRARIPNARLDAAVTRPQGDAGSQVLLAQRDAPPAGNDDAQAQASAPLAQGVQQVVQEQQALADNEYRQRKMNIDRSAYNYSNSLDGTPQSDQGWLTRSNPKASKSKSKSKSKTGSSLGLGTRDELPLAAAPQSESGSTSSGSASRGIGIGQQAEPAPAPEIRESVTAALWIDGELLLARRASAADGEWIEGSWIDWPHLREQMLGEISDLLPEAKLVPVASSEALDAMVDKSRLLATLPLRLEPGIGVAAFVAPGAGSALNPITLAIGLAWIVVLFVLGATAALLRATMDLSERRGAFVSAVTHELRTPLTTFRMYTEMLSEDMVTDEAQRSRYIETLRREAHRLDNLVQNVLTYARIEDERAQVNVEEHRVGELIDSMVPRLRERAEQAEFEFELWVDPEVTETTMRVDLTALEQILFNLVDNASKYGRGDDLAHIEIRVFAAGREVAFEVRDHGSGIAPEELTKVFRPFQKADEHAAGTLPGVGLGLALCRQLAEAMSGQLSVSDAKPGARFSLRLPRDS